MRLVIFGPPGAGKGTQSEFISQRFDIPHISSGEMFRDNIANGTPVGIAAQNYIKAGALVPDDITIEMMWSRIQEPDCQHGYLLDGYPRSIPQADEFWKMLEMRGAHLDAVLNMIVPDDISLQRMSGRGRSDDDLTTIRKRLEVYHDTTKPLIEYYGAHGVLKDIIGVGPITSIRDTIFQVLDSLGIQQ
jgi:adenylate kinase